MGDAEPLGSVSIRDGRLFGRSQFVYFPKDVIQAPTKGTLSQRGNVGVFGAPSGPGPFVFVAKAYKFLLALVEKLMDNILRFKGKAGA